MANAQSPDVATSADVSSSKARVRLLTVIAGVEIILGFLGCLAAITTLFAISQGANALSEVLAPVPGQGADLDATMEQIRSMWRFIGPILVISVLVSFALSIARIIAGIGLWQLKMWGATLTTVLAWIAIAGTTLTILGHFLRAVLRMLDPAASGLFLTAPANATQMMPAVAALGFWILTLMVVRNAQTHAIMRTRVTVTILHHGDSVR